MPSQEIAVNRKAFHDYFISDQLEAGLVLTGSEVKSIREGRVNLKDSYVAILSGEAHVIGMHISPYSHAENVAAIDPTRTRKLLLHRSEIEKLEGLVSQKGMTCVPVALYFKKGVAKLRIGAAKGKREHDKRETLKKKIHDREMRQGLKQRSG